MLTNPYKYFKGNLIFYHELSHPL